MSDLYNTVMDRCDKLGLVTGLEWQEDGWHLDVFSDTGRVLSAVSQRSMGPSCLAELAGGVAAGLYRTGRG